MYAGFSPCVCKLDANLCPIRAYEVDGTLERDDMFLVPYSIVFRGDTTFRKEGSSFHGDGTGSSSSAAPKKWRSLSNLRALSFR